MFVVFLGTVASVYAATDYYIKLGDIKGEVKATSVEGMVGQRFILDGSTSIDDGTMRTYSWRQTSGPYKFSTQSGNVIYVTPPMAGTYEFEFVTADSNGRTIVVGAVQIVSTLESEGESAPGPAIIEVVNPSSVTDSTNDNAAGPAILEIDPVEGDPDHIEREAVVQYNESDLDFLQRNTISIEAREIREWDEKEKSDFLETVKEHSQVKSGQELENFAKGILLKDENVKSIQVDEEKVKIEYEMPARFLGIFNTSLVVRAEVIQDRLVKVAYPWHSFLFKKLVAVSDIESETKAILPEIDDEVLVLFETRAFTIETLSNIMKVKHDTAKNSINNIR